MLGLIVGGSFVLLGISLYTAESYGLVESVGLALLGLFIGALSFPYYVFRDDERVFAIVNAGDQRATFDVTMTPADTSERIRHGVERVRHRVDLAPGDGTTLSARLEEGTTYAVSVTVDGETELTTDVTPVPTAAELDDSTVFTLTVDSTAVRGGRYVSSDVRR